MGANDTYITDFFDKDGVLSQFIKGYEPRKEQVELSSEIYHSLSLGQNLISEAPTGTGKSIAYLVPAIFSLKKFGDENDKSVHHYNRYVISTATKALQEQLFYKDIPLIQEAFKKLTGKTVTSMLVKGRGNYISLRRFEEFRPDFADEYTYNKIKQWLSDENCSGDFDELDFVVPSYMKSEINSTRDDCEGKECPFYSKCKYNAVRRKMSTIDLLIVNHDLLSTDIMLKNKIGFGVLPDYDGIILDEAHHFEDILGKYLGFRISRNTISSFNALIGKYLKLEKDFVVSNPSFREEADKMMLDAIGIADRLFNSFVPKYENSVMRLKIGDISSSSKVLYKRLVNCIKRLTRLTNVCIPTTDKSAALLEDISSRYNDIKDRFSKLFEIEEYYDDWVYWSSITEKGHITVDCRPIDISNYLYENLFQRKSMDEINHLETIGNIPLKSVILTSATITTNNSFYFIKERLGLDEDCNELVVDSVFDYKHQALLYIPKNIVEPNGNDQSVFTRLMAQNVVELVNITNGRAFVLFTSYSEMEKVYNMTRGSIKHTVLKQGDYPKSVILEKFKSDVHSVLFATSSFWEGVSIDGEALSLVIIDKLPFPVPTEPIVEARIDRMKADGENWFNDYYIPVASIALKQGFGRLIRTVNDVGIFALLDKRVITKPYGRRFINSLPDTLQTRNIEKVKVFADIMNKKNEKLKQTSKP